MNPTRVSIAVLTSVMVFCPALKAESYRVVLRAAQAFEEGQGAWKVQLNEDKAVVLYDRVLIEDDGPGIGSVAEWMKTDRADHRHWRPDVNQESATHRSPRRLRGAAVCTGGSGR